MKIDDLRTLAAEQWVPDRIEAMLCEREGRWTGEFRGLELSSHFQAILSPAHRRIVGTEGLIRARDTEGRPVSPPQVFARAITDSDLVMLDRLTRAVHLRNFAAQAREGWLFLNTHPVAITSGRRHGAFLEEMIRRCGIPAGRLVIEVLESELIDDREFADAVEYYRQFGCLIAIDDFGKGHSNVERIWRLKPDIVKLDRCLISEAARSVPLRRAMPGLVALLHQTGCMVVAEGVETQDEAVVAMDSDVDFLQGYLYARPAEQPVPDAAVAPPLERTWCEYRASVRGAIVQYHERLRPYRGGIEQAAALYEAGQALEAAAAGFLAIDGVDRCYLLDANGVQEGANLMSGPARERADARFAPISDPTGADWSRRHYFRRALAEPGEVQVTRPYLSITGVRQCITLSRAVEVGGRKAVLCGDVNWN